MYICRFKDMYINRIMLYTSAIIFKSLDLLLFTCSSLNQSIIRKYLPQIFISLLQKNINTRNFKQIELDILIWMKLRQFLINVVFFSVDLTIPKKAIKSWGSTRCLVSHASSVSN